MSELSASSIIAGLVSGIISSTLTYFGTRSKIRLDMTVEYDKALHQKRLDLYKELWPKTKPLAEFAAEVPLSYNVIKQVTEQMRDWYFQEGRIYLSRRSRRPYFDLKTLLQAVLDDEKLQCEPNKELATHRAREIRAAAGNLRTSLADDIRARRGPWL
jgi:hypothetical protein